MLKVDKVSRADVDYDIGDIDLQHENVALALLIHTPLSIEIFEKIITPRYVDDAINLQNIILICSTFDKSYYKINARYSQRLIRTLCLE